MIPGWSHGPILVVGLLALFYVLGMVAETIAPGTGVVGP